MSIKGRIKKWLTHYRQWQRNPFRHIPLPSDEKHHCNCCETDFLGNFCPRCGQKTGEKHNTWASLRSGFLDMWGLGTRSLPYTLWQLIWRPGYLIGDYISGRRQISFPPFKMLVFVSLFVFILSNWVNPEPSTESFDKNYFIVEYLEVFFSKHYDWATMMFFLFFIIPTYFIFRYAPRCSHHTIPDGFFIQVFMCTKCVIYFLLINIADALFDVKDSHEYWINIFTFLLLIIMVYRVYKQLFGYGFVATLWRVLAVVMGAIFTLLTLLSFDSIIASLLQMNGKWLSILLCRFIPFLLLTVLIIYASYRISRHTVKK